MQQTNESDGNTHNTADCGREMSDEGRGSTDVAKEERAEIDEQIAGFPPRSKDGTVDYIVPSGIWCLE